MDVETGCIDPVEP